MTWVFCSPDESKNECHLKSDGSELADYIGTCQDQVRIQRPNPLAVSGFICRTASRNNSAACWSTVSKYPWFCFLGEDIDVIFGAGQTTSTTPSPPRPAPTVPVSRPPPTRPQKPTRPPTTSTRPTTSIAPPPKDSTPRPPKTPLEGQSAVVRVWPFLNLAQIYFVYYPGKIWGSSLKRTLQTSTLRICQWQVESHWCSHTT